jgi:hypothetical protein
MMPQWQCYPAIPTTDYPFNWDWLSQPNPEAAYSTINKQKVVISSALMLLDP